MFASITAWLVSAGVPQRLAKPVMIGAAILAAIAAFLLWLHFHDRGVVRGAQDHAEAKAAPIIRKADESASESRARGDEAVRERQEAIHDATDKLPDQSLTPRDRARYCAILVRQAHERGTEAPAGC